VTNYQQSDSLSTDTNVPMSGTGSSTPEAAAGNASYSAWPWEVMLATVLDIAVPDRGEVTGQSWLTVLSDGQGADGAHLIWTAGWDTSPKSGATSIQVYLNPALYTSGGAWDRFLNAPSQAMSGVTGGNYAGLPLNPEDFNTVSLSVAAVRDWMASATDQFAGLYQHASSGPIAKFQGNLAGVVADLLADLRGFMASLHEQMTSPTAYDASIAAAGEAASQYLTDLVSAYTGWTQVPEHSPLGAVVQVLEDIATPGSNGAYVIPDPQDTPYGDLTVAGSWAAVEQQAKALWTDTLTGGSPDFAGLDPLGQAALAKLVDQFATTTSVIVPVLGPAPPPLTPNPVNPGGPSGQGGPSGSTTYVASGGPGGSGGPSGPAGPGPALLATSQNGGTNGPALLGGGPAGSTGPAPDPGPANLAVQSGGQAPGGQPGAPVFAPLSLLAAGPAGQGSSQPGTTGNPADPTPAGELSQSDGPATDLAAGGILALAGAIGADPDEQGPTGDLAGSKDPAAGKGGFSGTIGRPQDGPATAGSHSSAGRQGKRARKGAVFAGRQAPAAGFSLGSDSAGPVLKQVALPGIVAKPPTVTSSPVNSQLAPASGGAGGPGGLSASVTSAGPGGLSASVTSAGPQAQASSAAAPPEFVPAGAGEPAMLAPGAAATTGMSVVGADAGGPVTGAAPADGGMMMLPPGGMRMGMGIGGGHAGRVGRLSYLPQEPEYWGTAPAIHQASLGSGEPEDFDEAADPDSVPVITPVLGIGARPEDGLSREHIADRRMP
jgi:hypothetical protein